MALYNLNQIEYTFQSLYHHQDNGDEVAANKPLLVPQLSDAAIQRLKMRANGGLDSLVSPHESVAKLNKMGERIKSIDNNKITFKDYDSAKGRGRLLLTALIISGLAVALFYLSGGWAALAAYIGIQALDSTGKGNFIRADEMRQKDLGLEEAAKISWYIRPFVLLLGPILLYEQIKYRESVVLHEINVLKCEANHNHNLLKDFFSIKNDSIISSDNVEMEIKKAQLYYTQKITY